jgi:Protein of unknown function (DUF2490)
LCALAVLAVVSLARTVSADPTDQVWSTSTVSWLATDRLTCRIRFRPKFQIGGPVNKSAWISNSTIPRVLYVVSPWIDVVGEVDWGLKNGDDQPDTHIVTPRFGVQLHVLSQIRDLGAQGGASREQQPQRRMDFVTLIRVEDQIEESSSDASHSSTWRFRDRFRVTYPLNRPKTTSDGAIYVTGDAEAFVLLDNGTLNELRFRSGMGYRPSFPWRFEALYLWTTERNTSSGAWSLASRSVDLRIFFQF